MKDLFKSKPFVVRECDYKSFREKEKTANFASLGITKEDIKSFDLSKVVIQVKDLCKYSN